MFIAFCVYGGYHTQRSEKKCALRCVLSEVYVFARVREPLVYNRVDIESFPPPTIRRLVPIVVAVHTLVSVCCGSWISALALVHGKLLDACLLYVHTSCGLGVL